MISPNARRRHVRDLHHRAGYSLSIDASKRRER
jgi:hypothetical protein